MTDAKSEAVLEGARRGGAARGPGRSTGARIAGTSGEATLDGGHVPEVASGVLFGLGAASGVATPPLGIDMDKFESPWSIRSTPVDPATSDTRAATAAAATGDGPVGSATAAAPDGPLRGRAPSSGASRGARGRV